MIKKEKIRENFNSTKEFFNRKEVYIILSILILIGLIVLSTWIRTLNVQQLKDITTNNWTLGPDLDPFLYLRHANEINDGKITPLDNMRYAPLGSESYIKKSLIPWAIFFMYKVSSIFGNHSMTYAAIIVPVLLFAVSIIGFFLFCLFLFRSLKFSRLKSLMGSSLSSFLYVISPELLHRTTGGVPEIESLGTAWYWFVFLFFMLAWGEKKNKNRVIILSVIAGLFTGLMSWSWGGYRYIYMVITMASMIIFLFKKEDKLKNIAIFSAWLIPALIFEYLKVGNLSSIILKLSDTGFAIFSFFIFLIYLLFYKTNLKKILRFEKIKIPDSIMTLICSAILAILFLLIINPKFVLNIVPTIFESLLYPFGRGRVGATIAENATLHLKGIISSFGYLFWSFLVGTLFLFYETTKHFNLKKKILLNGFFWIFIAGIIFSRISPQSILNGENFISKLFYIGGILIFAFWIFREYVLSEKNNDENSLQSFNKILPASILLLAFTFWIIVSMKGAVRLYFIISHILIITSGYLLIQIWEHLRKSKEEVKKILLFILLIAIVIMIINISISNTKSVIAGSKSTVPGIYEQQWQKAMNWVRTNTPIGSIFVHWWDYGYWVQTLGKRPTVTDGGHFIGYWDHLVGRYLLTETNPNSAMSFMKSHNVTYLLIDSTDLGKYAAYSRIGGDNNYDRSSYTTIIISDKSNIKETQNSTIRVYQGGIGVDEDIIYEENGTKIFLPGPTYNDVGDPSYKSFLIGVFLEIFKNESNVYSKQAEGIFVYNGQQIKIPLRYVYYDGKLIDFKKGINSTFYVFPRLYQYKQGSIQIDPMGSGIYLSPKISQSLFVQLYLMNDVSKKYPNVKLTHSQDDYVVENLKQAGFDKEFIDYNGFRGPIKIWKIENNESILAHEEFLRTSGDYAEFDNLTFVK